MIAGGEAALGRRRKIDLAHAAEPEEAVQRRLQQAQAAGRFGGGWSTVSEERE